MKLSVAVTTHNEGHYLKNLFELLLNFAYEQTTDVEIVVLDDFSDDELTLKFLGQMKNYPFVVINQHRLNGDFATHKNVLLDLCSGDWILNLDGDEFLDQNLLVNLPHIIDANPEVEAYWFPRVNTVDGLTLSHVQKWGWVITTLPGFRRVEKISEETEEYKLLMAYDLVKHSEDGWVTYDQPIIQWPDPQMRLFRRDPKIRWEGKVHERINGFTHYSMMPNDPDYAIRHFKEIRRQEQQNALYDTIQR
jgi:glycosyltransferase involved in cell wall biosynthesis